MHLFTIVRGIKHLQDQAINDLQAQFFKHSINGNDTIVQLAMRPIRLYEMVFPESALKEVVKTIAPSYPKDYVDNWLYMAALRKALGAKKLPEMDLSGVNHRIIRNQWVPFHIIGFKEDDKLPTTTEML